MPTLPPMSRGHTHRPVHSADRGGELGLQPEHKGFHEPMDAGLFRGLGTIRRRLQKWPWCRGRAPRANHGFLHTVSPRETPMLG